MPEPETEEEAVALIRQHVDLSCRSCGAHGAMIDITVRPPAPVQDTGPSVVTIPPAEEEPES